MLLRGVALAIRIVGTIDNRRYERGKRMRRVTIKTNAGPAVARKAAEKALKEKHVHISRVWLPGSSGKTIYQFKSSMTPTPAAKPSLRVDWGKLGKERK